MATMLKQGYSTQNGVVWNLESISKKFLTPINLRNNPKTERLPIASEIFFIDDIWDFNEFNTIGKEKAEYTFNFNNIDLHYKDFLKNVVLKELLLQEKAFSTTKGKYFSIKKFISYLEEKKIEYIELIDKHLVIDYFNMHNIQARALAHYKRALTLFFDEIKANYPYADFDEVFEILKLTSKEKNKIAIEQENSRFELIPIEYFRKIASLAIKDVNLFMGKLNEKGELNENETADAISAGLIVILAETGMRIGELHKLEINKLRDIKHELVTKVVYYLDFITYKTTQERDGHITHTYMSDIAVHAYNSICEFTKKRRIKKASKYLIINTFGKKYGSVHSIGGLVLRFFVRHQEEIGFTTMSKEDIYKFKCKIVTKTNINKIAEGIKDIGRTIYYASCHQFRVTCATRLYQKGKHLDWIMIHMNHMSDTMTQHYIRISELEKDKTQKIANGLMIRASKDGSKIEVDISKVDNSIIKNQLERDEIKKNYEAMNHFIRILESQKKKKYNLKVYKDVKEIIEIAMQNQAFITEMEFGFCVNTFIKMCKSQPYICSANDKLYDIVPHIPDLYSLEFNFNRFKEKSEAIKNNEKLVKRDGRYINEYERELIGMKKFVERTFLPELELLKDEISNYGEGYVIKKYKNIINIIKRLPKIEQEALKWKLKVL